MEEDYERFRKLFEGEFALPFDMMSEREISEALVQKNCHKYFDSQFAACELSIYEIAIESPFDVSVHWRRHHEFLKADYERGLLAP